MDEESAHTSLTFSTEHDSIYTYSVTSENCLADGSQCYPYPDQLYEQMQIGIGHTQLHLHSCSVTLISTAVLKLKDVQRFQRSVAIKKEKNIYKHNKIFLLAWK